MIRRATISISLENSCAIQRHPLTGIYHGRKSQSPDVQQFQISGTFRLLDIKATHEKKRVSVEMCNILQLSPFQPIFDSPALKPRQGKV
jgi:hypothetical protein